MRPLEMPSRQARPQREQTGRLGQFDECFVIEEKNLFGKCGDGLRFGGSTAAARF